MKSPNPFHEPGDADLLAAEARGSLSKPASSQDHAGARHLPEALCGALRGRGAAFPDPSRVLPAVAAHAGYEARNVSLFAGRFSCLDERSTHPGAEYSLNYPQRPEYFDEHLLDSSSTRLAPLVERLDGLSKGLPAVLEKPIDFGTRIGVSRQCISDYIKRGRLSGDALVGDGRSIMIDVEKATAQLAKRLDPDKRLTNGKAKLTSMPANPAPTDPATDTYPLSADAAQLMAVLSEVPSIAAWDTAVEGETTQRAFDAFVNLRMNLLADLRLRGFVLDDGIAHFVDVDWTDLAEEMGLVLVDPEVMRADWQRRRDAL